MKGQLPVRQRSTWPWDSRMSNASLVVLKVGKRQVTPSSIQSELTVAEKCDSADLERIKKDVPLLPG
jgi:hypothetical protein